MYIDSTYWAKPMSTLAPPHSKQIRLLVADDHPVTREGLALLLDSQPDMKVIAQAKDGRNAVEYFERFTPDVAILDVQMPFLTGVEATARILQSRPDAKIVLLTTYDGDEDVFRGYDAGAKAYLLKETPTEELLSAIRSVNDGDKYLSPTARAKLAYRQRGPGLTTRELEVLRLVASGLGNKQVASELAIGEGTIKSHVNSIMSKLGVASRTEAVMAASARGMLRD